MNPEINSMKSADKALADINQRLLELETQKKELTAALPNFVDNPKHMINQTRVIPADCPIHIPVVSETGHISMEYRRLKGIMNSEVNLPIFFEVEGECNTFLNVFKYLKDIIKFKHVYEPIFSEDADYYITFDRNKNEFVCHTGIKSEHNPTVVYFLDETICKNCCLWLNYRYKCGEYMV